MKTPAIRLAVVATFAIVMSLAGIGRSSADSVNIRFGYGPPSPPPPSMVDSAWARPYRGAVWIAPHYELIRGRWVWVRGYYTYPPRRGGYWVQPVYRHGYYYPGHWSYGR